MPTDPVLLVREENGFKRRLFVDSIRTGGLLHPRAMPPSATKKQHILGDGVLSSSDLPKAMKAFRAKLSAEGWSEKLDAKQIARIEARHAKFPSTPLERKLAAAIAKPAEVTSLDLRGKPKDALTFLPPTIKALTKLRVLILDNNAIETLPAEVAALQNLEYLSVARNHLTDMRPAAELKKLRLLNLHQNHLVENLAGKVQKNFELQIAGNKLTSIGAFPSTHTLGIDTDALYPLGKDVWKAVKLLHIYGRDLVPVDRKNVLKQFPNAEIKYMDYADKRTRPQVQTKL